MNQINNIQLMEDVIITVHDKDFNITHANSTAKNTLKLPELENAKIKCYEYYHGHNTPHKNCPMFKCVITGKPQTITIFEPKFNKHILTRVFPCFNDNEDFVGVVHFTSYVSG